MHKAHVQHAVGLVQHKYLQPGKVDIPLAGKVVQAAGRGSKNIHALLQCGHLRALAHAAKNHQVAQRQMTAIGGKAFVYLQSQLARGRKHQCANIPPGAALGHPVQNGHGKSRRFARARLCAAQHIAPGKHRANGLFLNGRRLRITGLGGGT